MIKNNNLRKQKQDKTNKTEKINKKLVKIDSGRRHCFVCRLL